LAPHIVGVVRVAAIDDDVTEAAAVAPSPASALTAGALKSKATHSCPARIRRRAMFEPMRPRPIIPIFNGIPRLLPRRRYASEHKKRRREIAESPTLH